MTPVGEILRDEIQRRGPVRFHRFMEFALYEPEHGYYRRDRDPFGKDGDFYTAEQLQPAFGLLMASLIRGLMAGDRFDEPWTVLELGAGRGEMAEFLSEYDYRPFEVDDVLPARLNGFVLANEFFDALPVDVVVRRQNEYRLMRVACRGDSLRGMSFEAKAVMVRPTLWRVPGRIRWSIRFSSLRHLATNRDTFLESK